MYIYGKIFGAIFGSLIAGPLGFLLGVVVGHFFDKGLALNEPLKGPNTDLARNVFFKTTFMMMGYVAKADGRVSEREIQMAREVMARLGLDSEQRAMAIEYFNQGKSPHFNWSAALDNFIRTTGRHPQLVRLFMEIQLQAAFVDGIQNPVKRQILRHLCDKLNIPHVVLRQMEARFYAEQAFYGAQGERPSTQNELTAAYGVLGVSAQATDQAVKRAYRQLMSQHHPDKLLAKGLPEQMIKMATEKTQKIQKAYETICQARGIK